jgi:MinD-like ATPase involved in chromosome partitioning or flagellar assembly
MKIVLWSPVHGQTGVSTNTAVLSSMLALTNPDEKVLLLHNQLTHTTIERYFGLKARREDFLDKGIDPIIRLTKSGQLEAEAISDYADSLLDGNNLDILIGSTHSHDTIYENIGEIIEDVVGVANQFYDYVIVDTHAGHDNGTSMKLIENADVLLVCLNQNDYVIEIVLNMIEQYPDTPIILLVGMYDSESTKTINVIRQKCKKHQDVFAIPYSSALKDSLNKGEILEFIYGNLEATKEDVTYDLMTATRKLIELVKVLKADTKEQ